MENRAQETRSLRLLLSGLLLITILLVTACGDGGDPAGPPPEPLQDYVMWSCLKVYRWNGLFNQWNCIDDSWRIVSNQPVFTSRSDCLTAVGIEQDNDPVTYDNSEEDRDRGYAYDLWCFKVDE
jgi:hypothetical protein